MQRAGQRDVVDVMARGVRVRPVLSPARHATINQLGVVLEQRVRSEAELFQHAGTEAFDQHVGAASQGSTRRDADALFQIDSERDAAAIENRVERLSRCIGPRDPDDLGAEIGEQHAAEGRRAQAGELQHAHAMQWAVGCALRRIGRIHWLGWAHRTPCDSMSKILVQSMAFRTPRESCLATGAVPAV